MRARREPTVGLLAPEAGLHGMRPMTAPEHAHPVMPDGRVQHYCTKVDGRWTCDCGYVKS